jgi:undecaprenyl-diphosphatase
VSAAHIAGAVLAVAIGGYVVWRWRRLEFERRAGLILLALALGVYASGALSALPDPKELIVNIAEALGPWTYALVGGMAFLETGAFVGLVAPGETVVIAGGVIAGQGEIDLVPLIGVVWICAVLGDTASFFIGRRLGRRFLEKHGPKVKITSDRLLQVEGYFERHGGKTILIGRFIGLVRALAPFVAGSSGLRYRRFIPFSIVGAGLWATLYCVLGYIFWRSFDRVVAVAGQAVFGFGITVAVIVGVVVAYRRREQIRQWLLAHQRHPAIRPLFAIARPIHRGLIRPGVRVLGPEVRFLRDRLTPGDLGLEVTTAAAVGGAGAYVFVFYAQIVSGSTSLTRLDRDFFDIGRDLKADWAVNAAKVITDLGSFGVVAVVVVAASIVLIHEHRLAELAVLLLGTAIVYLGVDIAKDVVDRPRPAGPLVETADSAFPSAHAAYSTIWVAVAVVLTRGRGLAGQAAIVMCSVVLAVVIGLTRVYLRAHYWSDVVGGWALGAAVFGLLATIALIVAYVRNNEGRPTEASAATRS